MAVVCPVCREVVHASNGCILYHGTTHHGKFYPCSGSYSPVSSLCASCVD